MATPLTLEERMLGLDQERAEILRRLGGGTSLSAVALARSIIAAAERDPSSDPALSSVLVALKMGGKDPITSLTFDFRTGHPTLVLRPGAL